MTPEELLSRTRYIIQSLHVNTTPLPEGETTETWEAELKKQADHYSRCVWAAMTPESRERFLRLTSDLAAEIVFTTPEET